MVSLDEPYHGERWFYADGRPELLVTENHTNTARLHGVESGGPYKDGINDAIVYARRDALSPERVGTKAAAHYPLVVPAGDRMTLRLRLTDRAPGSFVDGLFDATFEQTRGKRLAGWRSGPAHAASGAREWTHRESGVRRGGKRTRAPGGPAPV